MDTDLIASELASLGFTTRITQTGVLVSLDRPVTKFEIEKALWQVFDRVDFKLTRITPNSAHVSGD